LLARQHYILNQMVLQKMITKKQAEEAKKVDVLAQVKGKPESLYAGIKAPYFVLAAKKELMSTYGAPAVNRGGWKVITTLDSDLQDLAEKSVNGALPAIQRQGGDNAAFVAEDTKTGQIVALVGGVDFNNDVYGKINFATDVNVSPGSSFKPPLLKTTPMQVLDQYCMTARAHCLATRVPVRSRRPKSAKAPTVRRVPRRSCSTTTPDSRVRSLCATPWAARVTYQP
jgi:membrane peptidoglycan carboxypeptidase